MIHNESITTRLKRRMGSVVFQLWRMVSPSLQEHYQSFDTRMFLANEVCPQFPWKKYVKKQNPYFKKWGFKVSQLDAEYYSRVSGIKADHYVTRSMAVHYIYPYLDRYDFLPAYMDKNAQKRMLGLATDAHPNANPLNILATEDIVYNCNGIFFDAQHNEISRECALDTLVQYDKDMILKPSVDTYGGHGVVRVDAKSERDELERLIATYRYNFTFQKVVQQHPTLAAFNPTSVNTIRIVTYRTPSKERKVLYSCMRFGGEGAVIDNVCSGGGYTGINLSTGTLLDRRRYSYFIMDAPMLPETAPNEIPCWDKIKEAALFLHGKLPQFDIVGWDFSITPEGQLVLIEYNLRPGVGLQQAVGPMFSKEDLDELMAHVSKIKAQYRPLGIIRYKEMPDRTTIHFKFG